MYFVLIAIKTQLKTFLWYNYVQVKKICLFVSLLYAVFFYSEERQIKV